MIKKQRYEIGNEDLETISRELDELVNSGNYPKYGTQSGRKTYIITRKDCSIPAKFLKYLK